MKMNNSFNNVEKSGDFESSGFTIDASPHAFQILSASLYSNKVQSVIRELSTNALDEHMSAEVDRPFEVHLPTGFEPWFSIRDFGAGLSEKDAVTLYTTFFKSTKRDSNTQIGCLGLGSKSPFAVTDSFTVESIHGGVKTVYTCYKDCGRPIISKVHSEPSNEPTGVMVKFALESGFWEWEHEAKRVYMFFSVKPRIFNSNGDLDIDINLPKATIQGEGWSVHEELDGNFAVMGNVAYPITFGSMNIDDSDDAAMIRDLAGADGIVFRYPLGGINFLPSREGLEYDRTTKAALVSSARSMRDDMVAMMTDRVEEQPSLYRARVEYVKLKSKLVDFFPSVEKGTMGGKIKSIMPKWGGKPIFDKTSLDTTVVNVDHISFSKGRKSGSVTITNESELVFHYDDEDIAIFVCPQVKGHRERVRKYSSVNEVRCLLLTSEDARILADSIGHDGEPLEIFKDASALPKSQTRTFKIIDASVTENGLKINGAGTINNEEETFYCIRNKDEILYITSNPHSGVDILNSVNFDNALGWAHRLGMKLPQKCVTMTHFEYRRKNVASCDNMVNLVDEVMGFLADYINNNMDAALDAFASDNILIVSEYSRQPINDSIIELKNCVSEDHPIWCLPGSPKVAGHRIDVDGVRHDIHAKTFREWWHIKDTALENVCGIMSGQGMHLPVIIDGERKSYHGHSPVQQIMLSLSGTVIETNAMELYGMVSLSQFKKSRAKLVLDMMGKNPNMPAITMNQQKAKSWSFHFKGDIDRAKEAV